MELLKEKVCVVTGAGKGFGYDLAKTYNDLGAKLALITRSQEDIMNLQALFGEDSSRVLIFAGDVSDPKTVAEFSRVVERKFKAVDVLINNAGMRFRKPFLDIRPEEFAEVMNCNLNSMFHMCQAIFPLMVERGGGKVVNMSSVLGTHGLSDLSGYITSKAAIVGLTKALAVEFANRNINVNALAPGFCKTSYYDNFMKTKGELYQFTLERTPLARWGDSKDIVNACLYLTSEMSDYVTGQVIQVDGGWSAW